MSACYTSNIPAASKQQLSFGATQDTRAHTHAHTHTHTHLLLSLGGGASLVFLEQRLLLGELRLLRADLVQHRLSVGKKRARPVLPLPAKTRGPRQPKRQQRKKEKNKERLKECPHRCCAAKGRLGTNRARRLTHLSATKKSAPGIRRARAAALKLIRRGDTTGGDHARYTRNKLAVPFLDRQQRKNKGAKHQSVHQKQASCLFPISTTEKNNRRKHKSVHQKQASCLFP